MSMLDTHVRTFQNELVSVPNSKILISDVINFSQTAQTNGLMIKVTVGIGYDEDPKRVEELLLSAAAKIRGLRSVPKPFVMYTSLNSHDVSYSICVYSLMGEVPNRIRSDLTRAVLLAFNRAGVQIMTPFYTSDPEDKKVPPLPDEKKDLSSAAEKKGTVT
jgi:small-conductance mechanosensitive channel